MRIAIDIDSTLHHYWDELADSAKRRFGVDLPYEHQHTWKISRLRDEQLRAVIADTHSDAAIARARALPARGRDRQRAGTRRGHWIHITSHRAERCHAGHGATGWRPSACATTTCTAPTTRSAAASSSTSTSSSTTARSPSARAIENGMVAATLVHPWNRDLCEEETEVVSAEDWPGLAAALELRLPRLRRAA